MIPEVPRIDNWIVRWPMRKVNSDLASALRSMPLEILDQMTQNAHYAKCWYSWYAAHLDSQYSDIGSPAGNYTNYVCPEWRTKRAYLAVMKLLLRKRRLLFPRMGSRLKDGRLRDRSMMPLSQRIFYIPDPEHTGTGASILYTDSDQKVMTVGIRSS